MTNKIERPSFCADEHLKFLDDLRDTSNIAMTHASVYVADRFGLPFGKAIIIANYWKETAND